MYADHQNETVNIVKQGDIGSNEACRMGDIKVPVLLLMGKILIMMNSDKNKQARVVIFTGITEIDYPHHHREQKLKHLCC